MSIVIPIISEFDSSGIQKARKEFSQLEGAGAKAQFAIKKAAVPAAAALAGLGAALFDATKGAIEDAAAQDLLANNLKKTANATDAQIAATEDWIATQGQLLGVTDDELRPVLSRLAKATGDVTKAQQLASQAMDIATATGKPLEAVTIALEKAYGGNTMALAKLAPELRDSIKAGASFDDIMADLAITTGGAATDAANTAAGQFKRLQVALSETKESIGTALIPVVEKLLPYLTAIGVWAQQNPGKLQLVAAAIGAIALAVIGLNIAMAANPLGAIIAASYLLVAALVVVYNKFEGFRNVVRTVVNSVANYFEFMANAWIAAINLVIKGINLIKPGKDIASLSPIKIGDVIGAEGRGPSGADKSKFDMLPQLASGGIVTSATLAVIGEAGPEAVIPLDRMGQMGGNNVTIHVNGGDPQSVVNALRTYMRQNGSVPIRVSNIY